MEFVLLVRIGRRVPWRMVIGSSDACMLHLTYFSERSSERETIGFAFDLSCLRRIKYLSIGIDNAVRFYFHVHNGAIIVIGG